MDEELSELWAVEYNFRGDVFGVRPLHEHLSLSRGLAQVQACSAWTLLGLYRDRDQASEDCRRWQEARNLRAEGDDDEALRRYV